MIAVKRQSVTVLTPSWVSDRGRLVADFTAPTSTVYDGCSVQPMAGEELHDERQGAVSRMRLIGPSTMALTHHDRVVHDSLTYDVEGPPQHWPSPTGSLDHVEATLRRVDG